MTAYLLGGICQEAGLPPGVFNIVQGRGRKGRSGAIVEHPDIAAISFTGGTLTGKKIISSAGPKFKKLSLELGGKNPNIIFADADLDKAVDTSIKSSFSNQGQICLCGSRIFVEKRVYEEFKARFVKKTQSLVVGDPFQEKTDLGAVISQDHMKKVLSYIDLARDEGGTILTGGKQVILEGGERGGFFRGPDDNRRATL